MELPPDQTAKAKNSKWSKKSKIIVGSLFALLLVVIVIISVSGAKAKYEVSDTQITVVDPTTVSVGFKVKNIGTADGQPFCTVNAHNPDSSNYGGNNGQLSSTVKAGDTYTTAMPVTITNQGADSVTVADVSCR